VDNASQSLLLFEVEMHLVAMENKHDEMVKKVEELQSTKDQLM
jgi:hypothetical protein